MYVPKAFENKNIEQFYKLIEEFNFATVISQNKNVLEVSHVPMMLTRNEEKFGTLKFHLAGLNPQVKDFDGKTDALCIFQGPHSYISPAWYKTYPGVPTWNYVIVHAKGIPIKVSKEELADDLTIMVEHHESRLRENPHYVIPEEYKSKLIEHIVGFKMEIAELNGKFKLGQNRSIEDQQGFLQGLKNQNTREALSLAEYIIELHKPG